MAKYHIEHDGKSFVIMEGHRCVNSFSTHRDASQYLEIQNATPTGLAPHKFTVMVEVSLIPVTWVPSPSDPTDLIMVETDHRLTQADAEAFVMRGWGDRLNSRCVEMTVPKPAAPGPDRFWPIYRDIGGATGRNEMWVGGGFEGFATEYEARSYGKRWAPSLSFAVAKASDHMVAVSILGQVT